MHNGSSGILYIFQFFRLPACWYAHLKFVLVLVRANNRGGTSRAPRFADIHQKRYASFLITSHGISPSSRHQRVSSHVSTLLRASLLGSDHGVPRSTV